MQRADRMQPGFFDQEDRLAKLKKLGNPLPPTGQRHGLARLSPTF